MQEAPCESIAVILDDIESNGPNDEAMWRLAMTVFIDARKFDWREKELAALGDRMQVLFGTPRSALLGVPYGILWPMAPLRWQLFRSGWVSRQRQVFGDNTLSSLIELGDVRRVIGLDWTRTQVLGQCYDGRWFYAHSAEIRADRLLAPLIAWHVPSQGLTGMHVDKALITEQIQKERNNSDTSLVHRLRGLE